MNDPDSPDEVLEWYCYRPGWSSLDAQGNLSIKYSGYDVETTHYTGYRTIEPTAPDHAFWVWLTGQEIPGTLVSKAQLAQFRDEFEAVTGQA